MSKTDGIPTPPTPEQIRKEKDKLDLRPAVEFVESNIDLFQKGVEVIRRREPSLYAREWGHRLQFPRHEMITKSEPEVVTGPHVDAGEVRELLMRMPEVLLALSKLEKFSYEYADEVMVPRVDEKTGALAGLVSPWPKLKYFKPGEEDKSRVAVGYTVYTAETIYTTALPETVYKDEAAARLYQTHVALHEFFHTVEFPIFRDEANKQKDVTLETDGKKFTFREWWGEFEDLMLSRGEKPVSRYAATYGRTLNRAAKRSKSKKLDFLTAVEEQVAEAFVAYQLNTISNDEKWIDFKKARPEMWRLMDRLCRAKLIREDGNIDAL